MTLHGPPVRASSHRTIWFALAALQSGGACALRLERRTTTGETP